MRIPPCALALGAGAWLVVLAGPWTRVPLRAPQLPRWNLAFSDGIDATLVPVGDGFRAIVARQLTGDAWQVRAEHRLELSADQRQVLRLRVRADVPRVLLVTVRNGAPPWQDLGLREHLAVGPQWLNWEMSFQATKPVSDAVLTLGIGEREGTVEVERAEVVPLPEVPGVRKAAQADRHFRLAEKLASESVGQNIPRRNRP